MSEEIQVVEVKGILGHLNATVDMLASLHTKKIGNYRSLDEFVLKNGKNFTVKNELEYLRKGTIKRCFMNAAHLALENPRDYIYCEGYALSIIPTLHAWCINRKGIVIECTWEKVGHEYYGIAFKHNYLRSSLLKHKVYGLIDLWEASWPLLSIKNSVWKHQIDIQN